MKKKVYFENLDGLRGLCFLSVFFFHSFHTTFKDIQDNPIYHFIKKDFFYNGNIGVNFFFVLSGFLITFLLIEEMKINNRIDLLRFWFRRILRIWPLYYFCILFGFICFPYLKSLFGQVPNETADPVYYIFFINNLDIIQKGEPDSSVLGVLWSIAIEEQFYLLWPILLTLFPFRFYWIPFACILTISIIFRAHYDNGLLNEMHTLSCIGDLAIGSLGAWLMHFNKIKNIMIHLKKRYIVILYGLFVLIYFFRDELLFSNYYIRIFERAFIAIVMLAIILEQCFSKNSLFKLSSFRYLSKLGVFSYGLYCLHFIGILITTTITAKLGINHGLWNVLLLETILALAITIFISWLSYRFYETPFLRLKNKFAFVVKDSASLKQNNP
jgi:peptidoglycan/LPS O-acetylase OafA/YrhL